DLESVSIIDFKTGKGEEDGQSLQLPIYHLLVANCQKWPVHKACYWYLERDNDLTEMTVPALDQAEERVLAVAKQIKLARKLELYKCAQGDGCFACKPLEAVIRGEGELVGTDEINRDIYCLPHGLVAEPESIIL
nr:PD-(D/E)XK nuclease family protein [bacterium]